MVFPQVSPPKSCMQFSSLPYVPHAPPISFWHDVTGIDIRVLRLLATSQVPLYI
jgi:hypothetical protein